MEEILEVNHVTKYFLRQKKRWAALQNISFSVRAGECLGIVGRSGCGKSTLARVITRLIPADEGAIVLCGQEITKANGKALLGAYEKLQMIFQMPEDSFDPRKTLGWSIGEPMRNRGWDKDRIAARIKALLTEVGLPHSIVDRYPHEASGGECQRAAIARAVSLSPRLLICDEATSALDVTVQAQVVRLISKLCKEHAIACLFITHDLALLPQIADRIIVMADGRIVEEGTPREVLYASESPYTRELMATDFWDECRKE